MSFVFTSAIMNLGVAFVNEWDGRLRCSQNGRFERVKIS